MKHKTYSQENKEAQNKVEDDRIANALARIGWILVYKGHAVTVKGIRVQDGSEIVYVCECRTEYYEIPETLLHEYLLGGDQDQRYFLNYGVRLT